VDHRTEPPPIGSPNPCWPAAWSHAPTPRRAPAAGVSVGRNIRIWRRAGFRRVRH